MTTNQVIILKVNTEKQSAGGSLVGYVIGVMTLVVIGLSAWLGFVQSVAVSAGI
jgi:hypothetical protein